MNWFPNIGAGVLAFLAIAGLAALALAVSRDNWENEVARDDGATIPAPTPAPAATAQVVRGFHSEEPDREIPDLTENQVEEVKSLLRSDPSLKALLAGESYTIRRMGPWRSGGEFIGALVYIAPDNPVSYNGSLPIAESYDKPEDGSGELYVDGGRSYNLQAEGIEVLRILVDLNKGKVVTIEVDKAASLNIDYGPMKHMHTILFILGGGGE